MVFRGTIAELRDLPGSKLQVAVFRVSRVWKGDVGPTFEMPAMKEGVACIGFWPDYLKVGNDLLLYASRFPGGREYFTRHLWDAQARKGCEGL